jgi:hypothetical protein
MCAAVPALEAALYIQSMQPVPPTRWSTGGRCNVINYEPFTEYGTALTGRRIDQSNWAGDADHNFQGLLQRTMDYLPLCVFAGPLPLRRQGMGYLVPLFKVHPDRQPVGCTVVICQMRQQLLSPAKAKMDRKYDSVLIFVT